MVQNLTSKLTNLTLGYIMQFSLFSGNGIYLQCVHMFCSAVAVYTIRYTVAQHFACMSDF